MKNFRYVTLLILFIAISVSAQESNRRGNFDINEFHEKKWQFIMSETNLSPAEMNAVKPIFLKYEQDGWELHKQTRDLFRKAKNGNLTDSDYTNLNDKMINFEIKKTQLLRDYHMKLRKLLKPETLFNYYRAEKSFERQLLNKRPSGTPPGDYKK